MINNYFFCNVSVRKQRRLATQNNTSRSFWVTSEKKGLPMIFSNIHFYRGAKYLKLASTEHRCKKRDILLPCSPKIV